MVSFFGCRKFTALTNPPHMLQFKRLWSGQICRPDAFFICLRAGPLRWGIFTDSLSRKDRTEAVVWHTLFCWLITFNLKKRSQTLDFDLSSRFVSDFPCFFFDFPHVFLDFPHESLRKYKPWPKFTCFLLKSSNVSHVSGPCTLAQKVLRCIFRCIGFPPWEGSRQLATRNHSWAMKP